jgi:hypothetical protein
LALEHAEIAAVDQMRRWIPRPHALWINDLVAPRPQPSTRTCPTAAPSCEQLVAHALLALAGSLAHVPRSRTP